MQERVASAICDNMIKDLHLFSFKADELNMPLFFIFFCHPLSGNENKCYTFSYFPFILTYEDNEKMLIYFIFIYCFTPAHEIHANATAEETVIIAKAHAAADKTTTMAEMSGVRKMCEKLNIIDQEQKMSLFYIHSLRTMENLYKAPDYAARSRFEM